MAVYQPHLFPRLHYMHRVVHADVFVVLRTAQFTRKVARAGGGWQPSGQSQMFLRGHDGPVTVSVPVAGGQSRARICDVELGADPAWRTEVLGTLDGLYGKAPRWEELRDDVRLLLSGDNLAGVAGSSLRWAATRIMRAAARQRKVRTVTFVNDDRLCAAGKGSQWMLDLAREARAGVYVCGAPAVDGYLDVAAFAEAGIRVEVQAWECPTYQQAGPGFHPNLSVLDAAANIGWDGVAQLLDV